MKFMIRFLYMSTPTSLSYLLTALNGFRCTFYEVPLHQGRTETHGRNILFPLPKHNTKRDEFCAFFSSQSLALVCLRFVCL